MHQETTDININLLLKSEWPKVFSKAVNTTARSKYSSRLLRVVPLREVTTPTHSL